jgi:catalase
MQGSGVNTYKWVNSEGVAVLVKYHWEPLQGIRNLTQQQAEEIQGKNFNHATQDLYMMRSRKVIFRSGSFVCRS